MWERERQVVRTYTTRRRMWFMGPLLLLMMLVGVVDSLSHHGNPAEVSFGGFFTIAMPTFIGMQWFVALAKWQFANPSARLTPGYVGAHLRVIVACVLVLLVGNPLLQAACMGISPMGPLAFALVLGGTALLGYHTNHWMFIGSAMILFFSGTIPQISGSGVWISASGALHAVAAVVGAGLVVWWIWRLAHLREEDEDYFVMAMGYPGSISRLEGEIQRKWQGRMLARSGIGQTLSDRWHDRLHDRPPGLAGLFDYGWTKQPRRFQAALMCVGLVVYALFFKRFLAFSEEGSLRGADFPLAFFVLAMPGFSSAMMMHGRLTRLGQELMRPVSRTAWVDGLLLSFGRQTLLLWLAGVAAVWIVVLLDYGAAGDGFVSRLAGFTVWSLAVQLPAAAIGLMLARPGGAPLVVFFVVCAGLIGGSAFIGISLEELSDSRTLGLLGAVEFGALGPVASALVVAVCLVAIGLPLAAWARRLWLCTELG